MELQDSKIIFFLRFYLFIWDREKERERERERERESTCLEGAEAEGEAYSLLPAEQGAQCGAWSQDPEIMTWAEGRCLTNRAT